MPPRQRKSSTSSGSPVPAGRSAAPKRCSALTTSGQPCQSARVPGLTVCKRHGGGTAASVRKSKKAVVTQQAAQLWCISTDSSSVSIVEELNRLARNKLTDITALRLKISGDSVSQHIGHLTDSVVVTEYDIEGTVQSKSGSQESRTRRAQVSVWVKELHVAEQELLQILRLLQEVTGDSGSEQDLVRMRMQTAREAARLIKAYPGISVDDVASEVAKRGQ